MNETSVLQICARVAQGVFRANPAYEGLCKAWPEVRELVDGLPSVAPLKRFPLEMQMVCCDILRSAGIDADTGKLLPEMFPGVKP